MHRKRLLLWSLFGGIGILLNVVYWSASSSPYSSSLSLNEYSDTSPEIVSTFDNEVSAPPTILYSSQKPTLPPSIQTIPQAHAISKHDYRNFVWGLVLLITQAILEEADTELQAPAETLLAQSSSQVQPEEPLQDSWERPIELSPIILAGIPESLQTESQEVKQRYQNWLAEKQRWDTYKDSRYESILESQMEPEWENLENLTFEHEANRFLFETLEKSLKLHVRLIRDVRLFHDEFTYQQQQHLANQSHELYEYKLKLGPVARESGITDAILQAMSALSVGIYQQEALEVIDRLSAEYTKPIQQLYDRLQDTTDSLPPNKYNYNFYFVYGKRLLDYTDTLMEQSLVTLDASAPSELDFVKHRFSQSMYDLYQFGQNTALSPTHLDLDELEQGVQSLF